MSPTWTPTHMASGKKKRPAKPRRRRRRITKRGAALTVFYEAIGLFCLALAYTLQGIALLVVGLLSALVGALTAWHDTHPSPTLAAPSGSRPRTANPGGNAKNGGGGRKPGTAVICTQTGMPTDKCTGNHKHAMSTAGVRRYRKKGVARIGDPYGTKTTSGAQPSQPVSTKKKTRTPHIPTTNNAQPPPAGERMRRVL